MTTFDVIVVGELNADLILQDMPSFPEMGKEKLAKNMTLTMGSASAILATNITRLGLKTGFVGKLGEDHFGEVVLETLKARNVDISGIQFDPGVKTGVTVVLSFPDDYAMVTHMGAMEFFSLDDVDFDYIKQAKHLHLSSFYLQPAMRKGAAELFKKAKDLGLSTSFDPGWDPDEQWENDIFDVLKYVDIFMPNEQESRFISGKEDIQDILNFFADYNEVVVITQGSKGAICRHMDETFQAGVFNVESKDTTGAGDSFNAGFLSKRLAGGDVSTCLRYGSACGAIATTKLGGSTASPTASEAEQFLEKHSEEIITRL